MSFLGFDKVFLNRGSLYCTHSNLDKENVFQLKNREPERCYCAWVWKMIWRIGGGGREGAINMSYCSGFCSDDDEKSSKRSS